MVTLEAPLSVTTNDFDLSSWDPFPAWKPRSSRRKPPEGDA